MVLSLRRPCVPSVVFMACLLVSVVAAHAQVGGKPGAFSRMGFGPRGVGLGNAMTAVSSGDVVAYYNPALLPWVEGRYASASMGFLSLDRKLNFLHYSQPLPPAAGVSFGIINAGVTNIDGRDSDGRQTGLLQTTENEVFLGFAIRFKSGISAGINLKVYYYHLYTDLTSVTAGLDFGVFYALSESLSFGATARDINSKYKWDTSKLYGQQGLSSEDKFPQLYTIGAAYRLPDSLATVSADFEFSNASSMVARVGVEAQLLPELTLRAGIDRIDLKQKGNGIAPAFGFTVRKCLGSWTPGVTYAYVLEPFSPTAMHLVALSASF